MRLLGVLLVLTLGLPGSARAQGRVLRARSGADIPIPPGFETLDRAELNDSIRDGVEAAYRRTVGERALTLLVFKVSVANVSVTLAELPRRSGPLPQHYADDWAAVMHKRFGDERLYTEVVPLQYDDPRHAFSLEMRTRGDAPARMLLARPDGSPEWTQIAGPGGDNRIARCLLRSMTEASEAGGADRAASDAARDCSVPVGAATELYKALTPAFFERSRFVERIFQILTTRGITIVRLEADAHDLPQLEESWKVIWTGTEIDPSARPETGLARRLVMLRDRPANVLAAVAASFALVLLGGLAAGLALWKLRLPAPAAAILGQSLALGLILTFSSDATREGELTATGLIHIVVSVMALPVTGLLIWLWSRRAKARPVASATLDV